MAVTSGFPSPYVDTIKESGEDSFIQRVPMRNLDIGARPSGMPGAVKPEKMGIEHVGGSATGRK